ncbi:unnamed protein product [Psylliodes chrysocephalus]|uniref:Glucosylceramidase n=1 Tax=Psylliodes chrysocephalus TaxID=3402493 RepID=A0A9P0CQ18_9CUCU|nr:unnamed protein product [Psylliodes chrysocephala]
MWRCLFIIILIVIVIGIILISINPLKSSSIPLNGCLHKDFGNGATVCVCNENHCDTISRVSKIDSSRYMVFTSNKYGLRFDKQIKYFENRTDSSLLEDVCEQEAINCVAINGTDRVLVVDKAEEVRKIIIDREKMFQKIFGWGGSFTDAAGVNVNSLSRNLQNKLMRSYFSEDGLEYNLGRVPIGASDFSLRPYTYEDTEDDDPNCEDPELTKFKLAEEDYKYKLPIIQEAQKLSSNHLRLIASPWSAPKWMKESKRYYGTVGYLKKRFYQSWANYFIKFLEAYKRENVTIWGLTPGNEPFLAMGQFSVPGMVYTVEQMRDFIHYHLGPTLRNSEFSNVMLMAIDDLRPILAHSYDKIFAEKEVLKYIDGISLHWYYGNEENAHILEDFHNKYPDKLILYTEACNGYIANNILLGSWERGEDYAADIIQDMNHWVIGWIDWNLALDLKGGPNVFKNYVDASIIVNADKDEFYKQPMYYAIGHFAKFVPRDSLRIYSTQCGTDVSQVAFIKPDGGIVIVILNKTDKIKKRYILDSKRGKIELELSPRSISTILYW